jgi:hypothetical protein
VTAKLALFFFANHSKKGKRNHEKSERDCCHGKEKGGVPRPALLFFFENYVYEKEIV